MKVLNSTKTTSIISSLDFQTEILFHTLKVSTDQQEFEFFFSIIMIYILRTKKTKIIK